MRLRAFSMAAAMAAFGCDDAGSDGGATAGGFEASERSAAIVTDFADSVVVPTYGLLAERLDALHRAVEALEADRTAARLDAARAAWVAARTPWEQSEGFLFGPVDANGFDPALDSWPVNRVDLDGVLSSGDALTVDYVAHLDPTLKGFHTAEYLLFGDGGTKTVDRLDDRQLAYLKAVTGEMARVGADLRRAWTDGLDGKPPYARIFKEAANGGNSVYPSPRSAAEEIVRGMIGILDEVANGKIADPFDEKDTTLVESQFSYNSLADFRDNLHSVLNAYTGDVPAAATTGAGLDEYVAERDADLDARIRAEIQAALDALAAIPEPFRDAVTDDAAAPKIEATQQAIRRVQSTLESELLPLVLH